MILLGDEEQHALIYSNTGRKLHCKMNEMTAYQAQYLQHRKVTRKRRLETATRETMTTFIKLSAGKFKGIAETTGVS